MELRRPLGALSIIAATLVTLAVALLVVPRDTGQPPGVEPSAPATATAAPSGLVADISESYAGPSYDPEILRGPTEDKPQSKLWFHDGTWWGSLFDNDRRAFTIWWLETTRDEWVNTGTIIDDRPWARQDVLWDGEWLVIASHGGNEQSGRHALEIRRFSYDPESRSWVPAANFPVTITDTGVQAASLARDATGRLWSTFIVHRRVRVVVSEPGDVTWSAPFVLPVQHAAVSADQAAIVRMGADVGVMWSNQIDDGIYFVIHRAGEPVDRWHGPEIALNGTDTADDHISIRAVDAADGVSVYAVVKTSLDEAESLNPLAPQVLVLARTPDGSWTSHAFGRVEDHHTRPIIAVDPEHRDMYVFATSPFDGGSIYMKEASLDRISFPVGLGTPVITAEGVPKLNNATTFRQAATSESGLVVLAADDSAGRYRFVEIGVPEATPRPRPAVASSRRLLDVTFDGMTDGAELHRQRFAVLPEGLTSAVVATQDDAVVARLGSTDGSPARLCHRFSDTSAGSLTVHVRVLITGAPGGDAPLLALRGDGEEVTGIRLLDIGRWAYRVGEDREVTDATWAPGRWYTIDVTARLTDHTYDLRVADAAGSAILSLAGLAWSSAPPALDEVCLQSPRGDGNMQLLLDEILVQATD